MRVGYNSGKLTKLFLEPLTLWTSAASKLSAHELGKCDLHNFSVLAMQEFHQIMESKSLSVAEFQSRGEMNRVKENEKVLRSIFETIILCGQENIPLRGLRHDSQHYGTDQAGKFQRLLDFRIDSGDKILENHFEHAPRTATYRSKTIQYEMIECCGDFIRKNCE